MSDISSLANSFLIAMPNLDDPYFKQTVVYICEHNEGGAIGLIINRLTDVNLTQVFSDMEIESVNPLMADLPILFGGPLHPERGFVLHRPGNADDWRSTVSITDQISLTTSRDILESIASGQGPSDILFALGFAGWDEGQLEQEILNNYWLTCNAAADILFNTAFESRWTAATGLLGFDPYKLSSQSGRA